MNDSRESFYWSIDLPGLGEAEANELLKFASDSSWGLGSPVDPQLFLTLHLDRATVEDLRDSLVAVAVDPDSDPFIEVLTEWLAFVQ